MVLNICVKKTKKHCFICNNGKIKNDIVLFKGQNGTDHICLAMEIHLYSNNF